MADQRSLVSAIANSYWRSWASVEDLEQEGSVGLLEAIDRFDCERGTRLGAYARPWIRAAILRLLVDNIRLVRVGRTRGERRAFFGVNEAERRLVVRGLEATPDALAELLGTDAGDVESIHWRISHADLSLEESIDGGPPGREAKGAESRVAHEELCGEVLRLVEDLLPRLDPRQAEILRERLLSPEPCTLQELGCRFGVSRERVRQIEAAALGRLRAHVREHLTDPELWAGCESALPR